MKSLHVKTQLKAFDPNLSYFGRLEGFWKILSEPLKYDNNMNMYNRLRQKENNIITVKVIYFSTL